jgi:hypothetical protein
VNAWHLDGIAPQEVTMTGPAGTTTLELKSDPNLVRPAPQGQPAPQARSAAVAARPGVPPVPSAAARVGPHFPTPPIPQPRSGAIPRTRTSSRICRNGARPSSGLSALAFGALYLEPFTSKRRLVAATHPIKGPGENRQDF